MATAMLSLSLTLPSASLFNKGQLRIRNFASIPPSKSNFKRFRVRALKEKTEEIKTPSSSSASSSADEITKKYGLEAGLWKIFRSKEEEKEGDEKTKSKGDQAKELLTKYGGAYLATSIVLSLISFALCYALINAGVDVQSLLQKVGISADATGEKVGTFALAYAAHKAASPIRFPPTVALTPIVARWIGKKVEKQN
ncbi:hypothetical protein SO802_019263 [Lithocarpus litseifolius]|uniref:DUF1279 domain-containing protein n=1 Tax=Lithocarpus litseifolius TaxID=425828 RepID=A0AAW2CT26_9ROSI